MIDRVGEEILPGDELRAALDALFDTKQPFQKNISHMWRWLLTPDLLTSLSPELPEDLAQDVCKEPYYLPDTSSTIMICRGFSRSLGLAGNWIGNSRPPYKIVEPFMYLSSGHDSPMPEKKAWLSVKSEQLAGRIEDASGNSYYFGNDRKLLTASSFQLGEDGKSTDDGITFKMILGSQDEPTLYWTGNQEASIPFIDLEQRPIDNILTIVRAAIDTAA